MYLKLQVNCPKVLRKLAKTMNFVIYLWSRTNRCWMTGIGSILCLPGTYCDKDRFCRGGSMTCVAGEKFLIIVVIAQALEKTRCLNVFHDIVKVDGENAWEYHGWGVRDRKNLQNHCQKRRPFRLNDFLRKSYWMSAVVSFDKWNALCLIFASETICNNDHFALLFVFSVEIKAYHAAFVPYFLLKVIGN